MDDEDRDSNASWDEQEPEPEPEPEQEQEQEQDEPMEDAEEGDGDAEEDDNDNEDEEEEPEPEPGPDAEREGEGEGEGEGDQEDADADREDTTTVVDDPANPTIKRSSATPGARDPSVPLVTPPWRPTVRPEALTAKLYDIVPTMAAPQATSINAIAITPDMRYWMTGGSDGYIRKYDGVGTINGKQLLTVAQRHPFVDSVVKAGILMSYWENEEPSPPNARGLEEHNLSPVYSLAVHSQALWLLSGLESGGINLQSVRHDEGKRITCLQKHSSAVSVLSLAPDEKSVLSGSWDKNIFDWDLNNGQVKRTFDDNGGQISCIELRPLSGAPIPAEASEEPVKSETIGSNNARPLPNGVFTDGLNGDANGAVQPAVNGEPVGDAQAGSEHESLFGSPGGSLFGDDTVGGNAFGGDDDNEFSEAMLALQGDSHDMGNAGDVTMTDVDMSAPAFDLDSQPAPAVQPPPDTTAAQQDHGVGGEVANAINGDATMVNGASSQGASAAGTDSDPTAPAVQPMLSASQPEPSESQAAPPSPSLVFTSQPASSQHDPTQSSESTFFSASIHGTIRIWDRRVPNPVARIGNRPGVPPWCMGACWSPDGNWIYAGRRNGTVEEFNIHKARSGWEPERVLKFPAGSGAVSAVRSMVNGRHLVCASHDILRLYDLRDTAAFKHSTVPFLIIPGPPRAGVISHLYVDPTSRFMISAAGTRGWEGSSTEVLIGYEINANQN